MLNSFRSKMIAAIFGCSVGALTLTGAVGYPLLKQGFIHDSKNIVEEIAHATMSAVKANFSERQGDMKIIQASSSFRGDAGEVSKRANSFVDAYGYYDFLVIADSTGKVISCNDHNAKGEKVDCANLIGQSISSDPVFKDTYNSKEIHYGDINESDLIHKISSTKDAHLTFGVPFLNSDRQISRVLLAYIDYGKILDVTVFEMLDELRSQGSNLASLSFALTDSKGALVFSNDSSLRTGTNLKESGSQAVTKALANEENFTTEKLTSNTETLIIKAHPMEKIGDWSPKWVVLTSISEKDALSELHKTASYISIVVLIALIASAGFAWWFGKKVITDILKIKDGLAKLAAGDLSAKINSSINDEIGEAAMSYNNAIELISNAVGQTQVNWLSLGQSQIEAFRLSTMVETTTAAVMLCDNDRKITYANPAVIKLLRPHEAKLHNIFPEFDLDNLIGKSIDLFHKHPKHQADVLKGLRQTYKAEIQVLDLHFSLTAIGLFDKNGQQIGSAVEWVDITPREIYRAEVNKLIHAAEEGNLSVRGRTDNLDQAYRPMMEGINKVVDAIVAPIAELQSKLGLISHGDLSAYVTGNYRGDHAALKESLNQTLDSLNEILGQVRTAADQVNIGSRELSSTSQTVSQGATEAAAAIEEISSSMAELVSMTRENANHAKSAAELAAGTKQTAEKGNTEMHQMMQAMNEIEKASHDISKIIKVIDEIAFQTNLLALNAAVEAARAGVHGKGFAVVAEEVRSLAARSSKAAKETSEMIENTITKVSKGSAMANSTQRSLSEIVGVATKVSNLVSEIKDASDEQAQGLQQVNQGLSQLDAVTQQNSAASEEAAASSEELAGQSNLLLSAIMRFNLSNKPAAALLEASPSHHRAALPSSENHAHSHHSYEGMDMSKIPAHCRQYIDNPPEINLEDPLFKDL